MWQRCDSSLWPVVASPWHWKVIPQQVSVLVLPSRQTLLGFVQASKLLVPLPPPLYDNSKTMFNNFAKNWIFCNLFNDTFTLEVPWTVAASWNLQTPARWSKEPHRSQETFCPEASTCKANKLKTKLWATYRISAQPLCVNLPTASDHMVVRPAQYMDSRQYCRIQGFT